MDKLIDYDHRFERHLRETVQAAIILTASDIANDDSELAENWRITDTMVATVLAEKFGLTGEDLACEYEKVCKLLKIDGE